MKTFIPGRILPLFILISCSQPPEVAPEVPEIKLVSTFDVALDRDTQSKLESQFDAFLNPQNLDDWMKHMSSKPHHVGSPWSKQNAEFIAEKFEQWGFQTEIETFEVLMPFPKIRKLELVAPDQISLELKEPTLAEDATSGIRENLLPGFNAFSADGNVTAELVYVNYGIPGDYEELARMGIEVKGKIVLARYGGSWRGIKPKVAYEHGAIGCIIFSDPKDDGYGRGDVYPKGPFRMDQGVQRGSVLDMPMYPGDPLTPGYGAKKDVKRLAIADAPTIMKIPVLPISYGDALPLLKALEGPVAPVKWRGGLPVTYHIGPGPAKVHLQLEFDWELRTAYNPVAKLKGSIYPDEWIMRGNHHDGWAQGASDPLSGMVSLMEEARAIGELVKTGWRPKRTLVYAGWDAEEPALLGSTEWVEYHRDEIQGKMVVYINTDGTGVGFLGVGGSHSLEKLVNEVSSDVQDPVQDVTLQERVRARLRVNGNRDAEREDLRIYPMGSGSDYTAFIHHAGVPALNLGFGGESSGGSYHSIFDSYDHYKRFNDGDYAYGTTLAKVNGRLVLRLSEADILPFRFVNMAENIGTFIESNKKLAESVTKKTEKRNKLLDQNAFTIAGNPKKTYLPPKRLSDVQDFDFSPLEAAHKRLEASAWNYEKALAGIKKRVLTAEKKIEVNQLLREVEQSMTRAEGLPRRDWFKNMIYAPGFYTGYGVKTLPGIREGLEERNWDETHFYIIEVAKALDRASGKINSAANILKAN
ncbi:MAG: M28 family peptidase [Candidatus Marinimicrobia bacterium]|nr:M28 family peptidase [Candidatus Neomarinimicrobiota bacterium]MBL7011232.1 M28 family peptidase [Candidatus Neomarinimicrobiota bacterium]MBL7031286.1 M28 family peptidase [Candidatus Neomarinimicrobiota bacterium]